MWRGAERIKSEGETTHWGARVWQNCSYLILLRHETPLARFYRVCFALSVLSSQNFLLLLRSKLTIVSTSSSTHLRPLPISSSRIFLNKHTSNTTNIYRLSTTLLHIHSTHWSTQHGKFTCRWSHHWILCHCLVATTISSSSCIPCICGSFGIECFQVGIFIIVRFVCVYILLFVDGCKTV